MKKLKNTILKNNNIKTWVNIFIKIIITLLFTLFSFKISEDKYDFFLPMAGII